MGLVVQTVLMHRAYALRVDAWATAIMACMSVVLISIEAALPAAPLAIAIAERCALGLAFVGALVLARAARASEIAEMFVILRGGSSSLRG